MKWPNVSRGLRQRIGKSDAVPVALALILVFGALVAAWRSGLPWSTGGAHPKRNAIAGVLGESADLDGFAQVTGPRTFRFPADHGAHPDYRSEWWYVTGNLVGADGREYGFQLTLFRFALAPSQPASPSAWATRQAWMAHLAITDVAAGEHYAAARWQRGALGLAGARTRPFRVWLDDWQLRATGTADGLFPLRLQAATDTVSIDLTLTADKPLVLQGDDGYSRKSESSGNASYYYSYTRLAASGQLTIEDELATKVSGEAWLDREWSTSALEADQTGWDWFALQLADGRDVMVYRLRRTNGSTDPASAGIVVGTDGSSRRLAAGDFSLTPERFWTSQATGVRYPVAWRLAIPGAGIDASVAAQVDDQEMDLGFRYWEGAVAVRPITAPATAPPTGRGYLEMTGYGSRGAAPAPR